MDTKTLTIVVTNPEGQPTAGARVELAPGGTKGVTGANGEVELKLGQAMKYDVTVKSDDGSVTVPYYVTSNGATRLVVNPTYVKSVEAKQPGALVNFASTAMPKTVWVGIGVVILVLIVWKLLRRH
jgi:hypothetical protein